MFTLICFCFKHLIQVKLRLNDDQLTFKRGFWFSARLHNHLGWQSNGEQSTIPFSLTPETLLRGSADGTVGCHRRVNTPAPAWTEAAVPNVTVAPHPRGLSGLSRSCWWSWALWRRALWAPWALWRPAGDKLCLLEQCAPMLNCSKWRCKKKK